jgi:hypothetical protein
VHDGAAPAFDDTDTLRVPWTGGSEMSRRIRLDRCVICFCRQATPSMSSGFIADMVDVAREHPDAPGAASGHITYGSMMQHGLEGASRARFQLHRVV